jgi:hypothetical protein
VRSIIAVKGQGSIRRTRIVKNVFQVANYIILFTTVHYSKPILFNGIFAGILSGKYI